MNKERLIKIVDSVSTILKEVVAELLNIKEDKGDKKRDPEKHRASSEHD